jgi:hypothetical protein
MTTNKKVRLGLTLGLCALVAGAAFHLDTRRGPGRPQAGADPASAVSTSGSERRSEALTCRLKTGARMGYAVRSRSLYAVAAGASAPGARGEMQALDGDLALRVLTEEPAKDGSPRTATIAAVFEDATVTTSAGPRRDLAAALMTPVLLRIDEECRLVDIGAPKAMTASARNQWLLTLKLTEFVLAAPGTAARWTAQQSDPTGDFVATYARVDGANGSVEVQRRRGPYIRLHNGASGSTKVEIRQAEAVAHYHVGAPWFDDMRISERAVLRVEERTMADVETSTSLSAREVGGAVGAFWTSAIATSDFEIRPADRLERVAPQLPYAERKPIEGLDKRSPASVITEIAGLLATRPQADYDGALNLLVQYLRTKPEGARAFLGELRAGRIPAAVRPVVFLGMQLAGGAEAHAALADAAGDHRLAHEDRLRAVAALADVPDPDRAVVDATMAMAKGAARGASGEDLRSGATLGLGTLARSTRLDRDEKARILEHLGGDLERATDTRDIKTAVAAAGNAGDPSLRARVEARLNDEPAVAAEAYRALTKMGALPATGELLTVYLEAEHPAVQGAIAGALRTQRLDGAGIDRCIGLLHAGQPVDTRVLLITLLGESAAQSAAARAALVQWLSSEKEAVLLTLLGRYLRPRDLL